MTQGAAPYPRQAARWPRLRLALAYLAARNPLNSNTRRSSHLPPHGTTPGQTRSVDLTPAQCPDRHFDTAGLEAIDASLPLRCQLNGPPLAPRATIPRHGPVQTAGRKVRSRREPGTGRRYPSDSSCLSTFVEEQEPLVSDCPKRETLRQKNDARSGWPDLAAPVLSRNLAGSTIQR